MEVEIRNAKIKNGERTQEEEIGNSIYEILNSEFRILNAEFKTPHTQQLTAHTFYPLPTGIFLFHHRIFLKFPGRFKEVIPGSYKSYVENRALAIKLSLLACIQNLYL
jgi:hypothetical protein